MSRRVFISFRYSDGYKYKEQLSKLFDANTEIINCSEDVDRNQMSEETIQKYLYEKLATTSVTIILLTPNALRYNKNRFGRYDDWLYDEIRYSLEDRQNNRTNGLIAVYTPDAKVGFMHESPHRCNRCNENKTVNSITILDNLAFKNLMNVKPEYKHNKCEGLFDGDKDSYCSFVSWDNFINDYSTYIDKAANKRNELYKYNIVKRL